MVFFYFTSAVKLKFILYDTGETSAGKSGFINILIGSDILPVSHLACTSTIIKIHNASRENKEIRVTDEKGVVNSIKMPPDADSNTMESKIKKYVSLKGEFQNHKYVDIFLPVPMLKGNTVIVDTPGIGTTEYPELSARLFEFLPRAVAFIYIIDASNAGGLENDRRGWNICRGGKLIGCECKRDDTKEIMSNGDFFNTSHILGTDLECKLNGIECHNILCMNLEVRFLCEDVILESGSAVFYFLMLIIPVLVILFRLYCWGIVRKRIKKRHPGNRNTNGSFSTRCYRYVGL
ncbi:Hypothetical predicted protein [Mytilus galloprovincialis]|uniref:Dynamin N-terminal domain-containing protein n=1 Tax=Mytilus galloprovincialis TaxID=29158 RepID=A0A8B6BGS2_MYTGA|nr:Hypothetical predicted protein [Mytilus galloprovincialis]